MNRKNFFKRLFGAAAVAVVAPRILAEKEDGYTVPRESYPVGVKNPELMDQIKGYPATGYFEIGDEITYIGKNE